MRKTQLIISRLDAAVRLPKKLVYGTIAGSTIAENHCGNAYSLNLFNPREVSEDTFWK